MTQQHKARVPDREKAWRRVCGRRLALCAIAVLIATAPPASRADDRSRLSIIEENDSLFFDSDKNYTQGMRLGFLGPDVAPDSGWNKPFDILGDVLPVFQGGDADRSRRCRTSSRRPAGNV